MADTIEARTIVRGVLGDVFRIWANFENFPRFMESIKSVTRLDDTRSHWVMQGPLGKDVEWDAEQTAFEKNRRIAWASTAGSDVRNAGQVTFHELGPNETEVRVSMSYEAKDAAGDLGAWLTNPQGQVEASLRRFKEFIESTAERLHADDAAGQG